MSKSLFSVHETDRYSDCTGVYRSVPECTGAVPEAETVRKWYEKQADTGIPERWRLEKVLVFGVLASIAIASAYVAREATAVGVTFILFVLYTTAADPLRLTRRKVSRASRCIVAAGMIPVLVVIGCPTVRTVIVAAAILLIAVAIAALGNAHWRASESYKMSRHVLKALQPDDNTDHRDACLTAWQADGAREVVAAAAEMGAYSCGEIEWAARKAAYTIGFCRASTITRQHEKDRTTAIREATAARDEADELRQRLEDMEDYLKNFDEYRKNLDRAERLASEGARAESEKMDVLDENRRLQRQVRQLEEANDELVRTADNPLLAAEAAEQLREQRLREAAEKGMSVRQTEAYANVSHRRAQEFLKAWNSRNGAKPKPNNPKKTEGEHNDTS